MCTKHELRGSLACSGRNKSDSCYCSPPKNEIPPNFLKNGCSQGGPSIPGRSQAAVSVGILGTRHSLRQKQASEHVPREAFLESKECRVFEEGQHSRPSSAGPWTGPSSPGRSWAGLPALGWWQGWGRVPGAGRSRGAPRSPGRTHSGNHPRSRRSAGPAPAGPREGRGGHGPHFRDIAAPGPSCIPRAEPEHRSRSHFALAGHRHQPEWEEETLTPAAVS